MYCGSRSQDGITSIFHTVEIVVNDVDFPPHWVEEMANFNISEHGVIEGKQTSAFDQDLDDSITYSISIDSCPNDWSPALTIDSATGVLTGSPGDLAVGECKLDIVATSGNQAISYPLVISVTNVPDLPTWVAKPEKYEVLYHQDINVEFKIADVDPDDQQSYTIDTNESSCDFESFDPGLKIDSESGKLSGYLNNVDFQDCQITIIASSGDDSLEANLDITFSREDILPEWQNLIDSFVAVEDAPITNLSVSAVDPLGTDISYEITSSSCNNWEPELLIDSVTGELSGTPTTGDSFCEFTVAAKARNQTITHTISVDVENIIEPLAWVSTLEDQEVLEDVALTGLVAMAVADENSNISYRLDSANLTHVERI